MTSPDPARTRLTRESIIARAKQQKDDIEQYFRDIEHWNTHVRQPDEEPVDADPDGTMGSLLAYVNGILNGDVYLAPERP